MASPKILNELKNMRSLFSKTYLMDDESHLLTSSRRPLHYTDKDGKFRNIDTKIKYRKVDKTVYTAKLLTSNIGYSIVSKEDGCRVDVKLIRIGDVENIPYTKPKYSENKAIWENIIPGMDIIIEFKPYKVKVWKILYKKDVARDVRGREEGTC